MMGAESVRNMQSDLAVTNKQYCQRSISLFLHIIQTYDARKIKQNFTAMFLTTCHLSRSPARPIQFTHSHITSRRSILILSSLLLQVPPSRQFPSGLPTKIMYELLLSSTRATYRALLHFITSLYLPHFKRTTTAQIVPINDIHILTVITFASNFQFLSAFAKLRKATITFVMFVRSSFRPSVRMEQSGLPLDGFS